MGRSQQEALEKAAAKGNIPAAELELIEEYEPDEKDLAEFATENGLAAPPSPEEVTLYVYRVAMAWYVRTAEEWTNGMIARFAPGSSARAVKFRNLIIVHLEVPETSILIGKKGATLDALQHVVVRALVTKDEKFPDVMLDVEGYREKKLQRLEREAKRAADKAIRSGRRVPLAPMSPAERKFIHKMLMDAGGVRTESKGADDRRHIVIEPLNPRPQRSGGGPGERSGHGGGHGGGNRGRGGPGGGGGGNRGGGGNYGNRADGPRRGGKVPVTDEQRQLLYGGLPKDESEDDDLQPRNLPAAPGDRRNSLLPDYLSRLERHDSGQDTGKLADELE